MRRCSLLVPALCLLFSIAQGQNPVALETTNLFKGKHPETISLFNPGSQARRELHQYVDQAISLTLLPGSIESLSSSGPDLLRLHLPAPLNTDLDLHQVNIYSATARILTSDGIAVPPNPHHLFYRGMISGNPNSLAIVSVLENKIQILYSDENGNRRIQPMQDGSYIAFEDKNILIPKRMECFVQDTGEKKPILIPEIPSNRMLTGACVEVYVECDYQSYLDNGSNVPNTEAWVETLWNEVIALYAIESIPVALSDVFVYNSPDPFIPLTSTSAIIDAFAYHIDTLTYNGRLAHFLSTRPLGGGVAYIDVLCSTTNPVAVSTSLSTTIVPLPTWTWSVEVVTHEMGHNMGSRHTHACAWNGNNTQIDDCGNQWAANSGNTPEGAACYNSASPILPIAPVGGTIMSYCHLVGGVGINFANGFGTQPGNVIRNRYNNASCSTGTCTSPTCTTLSEPLGGATNVDINQDLFWLGSQGVNGYVLNMGTTPGGTNIVNNLDVGLVTTYNPPGAFPFTTSIYVKLVPYNRFGSAIGCVEQSFVTEANVTPTCTHLTNPVNGATNVDLTAIIHWMHSVGSQTGYKISIGTTPGGTQIANMLNVGNVNYYNPPGLLPVNSTIYVKITPYGANGDVQGCITESFTTLLPVTGDYCGLAISLPCGSSLQGNTTQALPDPEAFTCGTSIDAPGLWYTFVGDGQNTVIATCTQFNFDTKLNAYSGSCSNLVCITGIDDYCNTGSLISFATTIGVTYYIFVQGWGGETGSFTLTRTCYTGPLYCPSQGISSALEWISTFGCAGFTKNSGSTSYSDYTNEIIPVSRGGSHPVSITPGFLQGARTEYYRVWIDLNKDGDFADAQEQVFTAGPSTTAVNGTITIPITASTGITRMRVSMRYNQAPPSCGAYGFGEVEDYTVNIRCNLVTTTLDDTGNGTLRNVSMCADDNENILFAAALNGQTIDITSPIIVDGQWKWMANQGTNITVKASAAVNQLLTIPTGKSSEIQYLTLIGGTTSPGSAIDNTGNLILRSCYVKPASGSSAIPIRNKGVMNVIGLTNVIH